MARVRVGRVLFAAMAVACVSLSATRIHAGPPVDQQTPVILDKKKAPVVVASACRDASVPTVTAQALLDELSRIRMRVEALRRAEAEVEKLRAELAAERQTLNAQQESIDAARLDVELARAEMFETVPPPKKESETPARPGRGEIARLSAVVKAMKADKAAPLLGNLDPDLAAEVLRSLARPTAAAILERIAPEKAADLLGRLATPQEGDGT